jgi:hypothetical protein
VLRPILSDTGGHALFLGTPKGRNHLFDLWTKGQNREPDWASWQFTTMDGGNVPPEEIEAARRDLDELTFSAEYLADFVSFEGRAYREFQRSTHLNLSRLNHWLPRGQADPEVMQGAADFHRDIPDALLPQADPVFDDAPALDAAVDMLDPQSAGVERLVGSLLRR